MDSDINDYVRLQAWIEPPLFYYENQAKKGRHGMQEVNALIAPEWDKVAGLLADGNYAGVLRLAERLKSHLAEWSTAEATSNSQRLRPSVLQVQSLELLIGEHGQDKTFFDSVGPSDAMPLPPERGAVWYGDTAGYQVGFEPDWSSPSMWNFSLLVSFSAKEEMGLKPDDSIERRVLLNFKGSETLGSARSNAYALYKIQKEESELWRRRVDLVRFRLRLVEQALLEHEVLGSVALFADRSQARVEGYDTTDEEALECLAQIWEAHLADEFGMENSREKLKNAAAEDLDLKPHQVLYRLQRARAWISTGSGPKDNEPGLQYLLSCAEDAHRRKKAADGRESD